MDKNLARGEFLQSWCNKTLLLHKSDLHCNHCHLQTCARFLMAFFWFSIEASDLFLEFWRPQPRLCDYSSLHCHVSLSLWYKQETPSQGRRWILVRGLKCSDVTVQHFIAYLMYFEVISSSNINSGCLCTSLHMTGFCAGSEHLTFWKIPRITFSKSIGIFFSSFLLSQNSN